MNAADLNAAIVCYNSIVDPGTYDINIGANILLAGSSTPINNATAGVSLMINGGSFAVDGQSISGVRVFNIAANTAVEMKSLTVRNGKLLGAGMSGAGILNAGTLTLTDSTVSGNTASIASGGTIAGGGIYNTGTLSLTNSAVSGNTVSRTANTGSIVGGGIYNGSGSLTLTDSIVSGNTASVFAGSVSGGGIYNGSGTLMLTNSTISGNTVSKTGASGGTAEGGGILSGGTLTMSGGAISNNKVSTEAGNAFTYGGGLYVGGVTTLTSVTVSNNTAFSLYGTTARGGGIFNTGGLTLTDATVSNNTASTEQGISGRGGGIYSSGGVTLTNSTVSGNVAYGSPALGGGIYAIGIAIIDFSTIYKNSALPSSQFSTGVGSGIYIDVSTAQIKNSIVAHTASEQGDDCAIINGTLTPIENNIASDGSCTGFSLLNTDPDLAALALNGGTTQTHLPNPASPAINGVSGSCPASDQRGIARPQDTLCDIGSVEAESSSPVCFPDPVMNEAELNAAIVCYNSIVVPGTYNINIGANIFLTASTVPINNATAGVGLVINGGNFAVDGQSISGVRVFNIAASTTVEMKSLTVRNGKLESPIHGNGAGISNAGTLTLTDSAVSGNNAFSTIGNAQGGGIFNTGTLTLTNTVISGNTVSTNNSLSEGGGIYSSGTMTGTGITVSGNSVSNGVGTASGGGIYDTGMLSLVGSTISDNTASATSGIAQGGGIYAGDTMVLTNSTVSGNSATKNLSLNYVAGGGLFNEITSTVTVIGSTISGNSAARTTGGSGTILGGGILNGGKLTLTNSTISGNSTIGGTLNQGGGIYHHTSHPLNISFSTIYRNSAASGGGGLRVNVGTATIKNSIVANTASETGGACFIGETLNVIGDNISSDGTCPGFSLPNTDPDLAALALNGGATQTHLPNPGSPAINGVTGACSDIDSAAVADDQRGIIRPQSGLCDIGSVEVAVVTPPTRIIIEKQTDPADDPTEFEFTGEIATLLNDNETAQKDLTPGQYSVSEIVPTDWDLTSLVCSDANSTTSLESATATINVEEGETVTCVFTNTKKISTGGLTVVKVTGPAPYDVTGYDFQFKLNGYEFQLDTDEGTGDKPSNQTFESLQPGSYTLKETNLPGNWYLKQVVCVANNQTILDHTNSTNGQETKTFTVPVGAGEDVVCTFTNWKRGNLQTHKFEDVNGNGLRSNDEPWLAGWTFTLYQNNAQIGSSKVSNGNGAANFNNLIPGEYQICETLQSGWTSTTHSGNPPCGTVIIEPQDTTAIRFGNQHTSTPNQNPTAVITGESSVTLVCDTTSMVVNLSGTSSSDPDSDPLAYAWEIDDVAAGTDSSISPDLTAGVYNVELTVSDGHSGSHTTTFQLTINAASDCPINQGPTAVITGESSVTLLCDTTSMVVNLSGTSSSDPDSDPLPYAWEINDVPAGTDSSISPSLEAGVYNVELTVSDGKGGTHTTSFQLTVNPPVDCLPTTATLTVKKVTQPAPYNATGYDFQFKLNGYEFQLDTDEVANDKPSSQTFSALQPGSYTLRETSLPANWFLRQMTCTVNNQIVFDHTNTITGQETMNFSIPLSAGQDMTCTAINEKRGFLRVRKFEDLNSSGTRNDSEPWLAGWTFTLYQDGNTIGSPLVSDGNGTVNFGYLIPGLYQVCETAQDSWNPIACVDVTIVPIDITVVNIANTRIPIIFDAPAPDDDGDGVDNSLDACAAGDDHIDTDADGTADACDNTPNGDTDNDGLDNLADPTPNGDDDADGVDNSLDVCMAGDDHIDTDGDGTADACDSTPNGDTDNDGLDNLADPTPNGDDDADGVDNAADVCAAGDDYVDTDGDGTADACDSTPNGDNDSDGIDNATDPTPNGDDDADGVDNSQDVCAAGDDHSDTDGDGTADACDSTPNGDNDSDGIDNATDPTPDGEPANP